jgi:hydroxyethylthiazole kinase
MISKEYVINNLNAVRSKSPLVHNITNYVVMNTTANALLAVGASPVMAHSVDEIENIVKILSKDTGAVIVISGPVDYIIDEQSVIKVMNGSPMMSKVTGLGCTATALVGAFTAINKNYLLASAHAMSVMGIAGELAANKAVGPGTMQMHFLDELYKLSDKEIIQHFNME